MNYVHDICNYFFKEVQSSQTRKVFSFFFSNFLFLKPKLIIINRLSNWEYTRKHCYKTIEKRFLRTKTRSYESKRRNEATKRRYPQDERGNQSICSTHLKPNETRKRKRKRKRNPNYLNNSFKIQDHNDR